MTVLAFASAKGSPGVTTTVLGLAACWPADREALVVDADCAGGDLVVRFTGGEDGLQSSPSTVQLAAAARSGMTSDALFETLQSLPGPGEVRALVGPSASSAASTALESLLRCGLVDLLAGLRRFDTLVDVGRLDPWSPAMGLVRELGSVVVVVSATFASVVHARDLIAVLRPMGVRCVLLVHGAGPYAPAEIADALGGLPVVGVVPHDERGARALAGEATNPKTLARSRLLRACAETAEVLTRPAPADDASPQSRRDVPSESPEPGRYASTGRQ